MRPIAVVTGASRGIGRHCARLLIDTGYTVIGTCRSVARLAEDQRVPGVVYEELDLSERSSIEHFCQRVPHVDLLINNAGISQIGAVEELSNDTLDYVFAVNLTGPIALDRHAIRDMRRRGGGRIVHVSSIAARTPVPFSSLYAGAKAALDAYAASLANEVHQFGIGVTNVYFDFVNTGLVQYSDMPDDSPYSRQVKNVKAKRDAAIAGGADAGKVAAKIIQTALRRKAPLYVAIGARSRLISLTAKLLPAGATGYLIRKLFLL
ncbi:MAG: SDR family NAD(P)-dependent oxidoreductase [Spirochaetota bacterium]